MHVEEFVKGVLGVEYTPEPVKERNGVLVLVETVMVVVSVMNSVIEPKVSVRVDVAVRVVIASFTIAVELSSVLTGVIPDNEAFVTCRCTRLLCEIGFAYAKPTSRAAGSSYVD